MLFVAILAAVGCVTLAVPPPNTCKVSEWGEWGTCRRECNVYGAKSHTLTDQEKAEGKGRKNMNKLVSLKKKAYDERERCRADDTCPHRHMPESVSAAIVPCVDGFAGEYPCDHVDLLSFTNFADLGFSSSTEGNDIWVWHDEENSDYYALMGTTAGTSFVRVTDPVNPEVLGILPTETTSSTWRDMKVIGNYGFIVSEASGHGMQVFDMTQLRLLEADSSRVFSNTAWYGGVSNTHNIASNVASNTLFLIGATRNADCGDTTALGGLHMVDVSDPENPTFAGCFETDGYVHDTECVIYIGPDTEHQGKEICFGYNEDSLTIYDVSNKNGADIILSRKAYDGVQYSHQGWATEDHRYLLLDDELDEIYSSDKKTKTYVWDIQDLDEPVLLYTYRSAQDSIDHNLYIRGNYAHQTNYEAGYRLLDVSNIANELTEVAYFDVFPSRTTAQFYGSWSNYPWMEDAQGNQFTVVSSIDYGLFILRPDWTAIEASKLAKNSSRLGEMSRFRDIVYATDGSKCPALVDTKTCVAEKC